MQAKMTKTGEYDFLSLPDKAFLRILKHLNAWNLMSLRLVCKTTKSWVESPDVLKHLVLHVRERSFLIQLMECSLKWSNVMILSDSNDMTNGWIRSQEYLNAFTFLKSSLRILGFGEQRVQFNEGLSNILSQCSGLEELTVGTLDLTNAVLPLCDEIASNLSNLKALKINYTAWETENDLLFFPQSFEKCTSLEYLKLPYILSARLYSLYPNFEEDEIDQNLNELVSKFLLKPVKESLLKETDCKLKFIDVENFELDQIFEVLGEASLRSGVLFTNVLETYEKAFTEKEKDLCGMIVSLLHCSKHLDFSKLTKLQSIAILNDCAPSSDVDKKYEEAKLSSLRSITLTLTNSILVSARFASCFLQQKRSSVETVDIRFDNLTGSAQASVLRTPKFTSSFPNLRRLNLDGFDGKPEDYLSFWKNCPLLECVHLVNCRTLNDLSIIGENSNSPALLNLKFLKRLSLEDGDASDTALEVAVAKIPLESLVLALPKVTMNGLSFLKCGTMTSSLMQFLCMQPEDCSKKDMKIYFSAFKNLKKWEIIF